MGMLIFFRRRVIVTIERRMSQDYGTRLKSFWNALLDLIPFREQKYCGQPINYCTGVEESGVLFYHAKSYEEYVKMNELAIQEILVQFRQLLGQRYESVKNEDLEALLKNLWSQAKSMSNQQAFQNMRENLMEKNVQVGRDIVIKKLLEGYYDAKGKNNSEGKYLIVDVLKAAHKSWEEKNEADEVKSGLKRKVYDSLDEEAIKKIKIHEQRMNFEQ